MPECVDFGGRSIRHGARTPLRIIIVIFWHYRFYHLNRGSLLPVTRRRTKMLYFKQVCFVVFSVKNYCGLRRWPVNDDDTSYTRFEGFRLLSGNITSEIVSTYVWSLMYLFPPDLSKRLKLDVKQYKYLCLSLRTYNIIIRDRKRR